MNRRSFLRTLALSAGGIALLGPELLVPKRTYFLPPKGGWRIIPESLYDFAATPGPPSGILKGDLLIWDWHDGQPVGRQMFYKNFYAVYKNFYAGTPAPGDRGKPVWVEIKSDEWKLLGELT